VQLLQNYSATNTQGAGLWTDLLVYRIADI